MPLSVRLDKELERLVVDAARRTGQSKSDVIRAGIRAYCGDVLSGSELSICDVMADEIGLGVGQGSTPADLARESKKYLRTGFAFEHAGQPHR